MTENETHFKGHFVTRLRTRIFAAIDRHITWFHDNVVTPYRTPYPWYHERMARVPTIDQCYTDDRACMYEADHQFKRDMLVESNILYILKRRFESCVFQEAPDDNEKCKHLDEIYDNAKTNWFIKYGELGAVGFARACYNKQKHRMAWERRHGPVGTGMREPEEWKKQI